MQQVGFDSMLIILLYSAVINIKKHIVTAIMHTLLFYHLMGYNGDKI